MAVLIEEGYVNRSRKKVVTRLSTSFRNFLKAFFYAF
ncbi:hypothetical protein BFZC1_16864 [Lysinibacillus fusiformis ZC1]|nr:hypothetical protein BFZC1_16864 [Lysinibacillus fusiformis ZC1]